jgi:hypothetical protein
MRTGLCILAGAALIAVSILIVGRYSVGKVEVFNDGRYVVYGVDTWTGAAFAQARARTPTGTP